ncbi:MAG: VPLPA-CTERM sorting domain-containing protein [Pseudomonadota bacterium]
MKNTKNVIGAGALLAVMAASSANALTVDFESVTVPDPAAAVAFGSTTVGGVEATFSCGGGSCGVFQYGGPQNAFFGIGPDEPVGGFGAATPIGFQGLTDETDNSGAIAGYDIVFDMEVENLSLDVIDLEGTSATLEVFSSTNFTGSLGTVTLNSTPLGGLVESIVANLSGIRSASLTVASSGTAIDNVTFDAVTGSTEIPLPAALPAFLVALAGLGLAARRRRA